MEHYERIQTWSEADLSSLPSSEDDHYEYKSGQIKVAELEKRVTTAASAFWNTGGGVFIVGIDDKTKKADGGLPLNIVNKDLFEWIDQILDSVQPRWSYARHIITGSDECSEISQGKGVLVLSFPPSPVAPHMAPDKKYYIRANGRTAPANHHIVEAIRARRLVQKPVFGTLLRFSPVKQNVVEMVILVLNDASALNVQITLDPLPPILAKHFGDTYSLSIPMINRMYPFSFEIATFPTVSDSLGDKEIDVKLSFQDIAGQKYDEILRMPESPSIGPIQFDITPYGEIAKSIETITKQLAKISHSLEQIANLR